MSGFSRVQLTPAVALGVTRGEPAALVKVQPGDFIVADIRPGKQIRVLRVDDNGTTINDVVIETND